MSAYAALLSVLRILETIHDSGDRRITHIRPQLRSLHEKATLLLDFLEFSITSRREGRTSALVAKMRSPAHAAEDVLTRLMSRILRSPTTTPPRYGLTIPICTMCASFFIGFYAYGPYGLSYSYWFWLLVLFGANLACFVYLVFHADYSFSEVLVSKEEEEIVLLDRVLEDLKIIEEDLAIISEAGGDPDVSADGALISLRQMLDSILDSGGRRISRDRSHLLALRDKVSALIEFLRKNSEIRISEMGIIDANIIRAAHKAKSLIIVLVPNRFDLALDWVTFYTDMSMSLDSKLSQLVTILAELLRHVGIEILVLLFLTLTFSTYQLRRSKGWIEILVLLFLTLSIVLLFRSLTLSIVLLFLPHSIAYQLSPSTDWIEILVLFFLSLSGAWVLFVLQIIGVSFYTTIWPAIRNYKRPGIEDLPLIIGEFTIIKVRNTTLDASGKPSELPSSSSSVPSKGSLVGRDTVVGLANDMYEIRDCLLQHSSRRKLASIVGMGGIGKTTLARQVYEDPVISSHFDVRAWAKVSQEYSFCHVLLSLLDSAQVRLTEVQRQGSGEELAECLHRHLFHRRYLIVIDDVWDTKIWEFLSRYLPDNDNGSRVLVTSRLSRVATYLDSYSHSHDMRLLNGDESWCLLRTKVFGEEDCPLELESIGREIARGCQGLPLAILVIGRLLSRDNRRDSWADIAENLTLNLRQDEEQCFEILGLSYDHLPHHLRPCFLYMGSFPKDSEIHVSTLFNLWTAEEFLKPCASKTSEQVAEDNLNDLIDRHMILVRRSSNGRIRTCSIHGLMRDVSVQKAFDENFLDVVDSAKPIIQSQRVSMRVDGRPIRPCGPSVRSFLLSASELLHGYDASDHYLDLEYLRVLDLLAGVHFTEFPNQIIRLVHLKYLAFHCDGSLPPSMWKQLQNLETVVHQQCSPGEHNLLPIEIWRMPKLRHLYVKPGCYLSNPAGYSLPWKSPVVLEHLQTLTGITNFKWTRDIIRRIPNLKKLGILYDVSSSVAWPMYQLGSLGGLHELETLKIVIKYNDVGSAIYPDPPKLAFPQNLKKLSLSGCRIPWEGMAAIGALQNLEALKLKCEAFSGPKWETVEGEFPRLVFLLLEEMSFTRWETDEAHYFPRLQRLVIRSCGMLEEIPWAIGDTPTLEMIKLVDCQLSAVDSAKEVLEELESMGNEGLKLHIEWSH